MESMDSKADLQRRFNESLTKMQIKNYMKGYGDELVNHCDNPLDSMNASIKLPLPEAKKLSRDECSQILKRNRSLKKSNTILQEMVNTQNHNLEVNQKVMDRMIEQREEALIQLSHSDQWKTSQKGIINGLNKKLNSQRKTIKSIIFFTWCGWGAFVGACIAGFYLR